MRTRLLLALLLSPVLAHANTCVDLFAQHPVAMQITKLREEAVNQHLDGNIALAKVLYAKYAERAREAKALGLDVKLGDSTKHLEERAEEKAREARARKKERGGIESWHEIYNKELSPVSAMSWSLSPDGKRAAYQTDAHTIRVEKFPSGELIREITPVSRGPHIMYSPTINWAHNIFGAEIRKRDTGTSTYEVYSLTTGDKQVSFDSSERGSTFDLDPHHARVAISRPSTPGSSRRDISIVDLKTGNDVEAFRNFEVLQVHQPMQFSKDGLLLSVLSRPGSGIEVFDLTTMQKLSPLPSRSGIPTLTVRDGFVTWSDTVHTYMQDFKASLPAITLKARTPSDKRPLFDRDQSFVLIAQDGEIKAYSTFAGELLRTITTEPEIWSFHMTSDGRGFRYYASTPQGTAILHVFHDLEEAP